MINKKRTRDEIECYKGFGHVIHECPIKDKNHYLKRKKVLQATLDLEDKGSDYFFGEF